jgi:SAM-dependent methyltransferase
MDSTPRAEPASGPPPPTSGFEYVGSELELFAAATRWKSYLRRRLGPYIGREVLEVGAGFGGTTKFLCRGDEARWVCLEPDATLADRLARSIAEGGLPACCRVAVGTLESLEEVPPFDTLLYIDVLEHIEDDRAELARAARRLKPGGHVVAMSPAHQWLFTPFDAAIGHYRRYTRRSIRALTPEGLEPVRVDYLDSVGLLASLGNRLVLNKAMPTARQIAAWDRYMVRLSGLVDPLFGHRLGKSVMAAWRKVG